jgi:hypothetical protein
MSRYPGAEWAPIPEHAAGPKHVKTQLVFHSTGTRASAEANRKYFAKAKVEVESTLIVDYDGQCLQVMETWAKARANGGANRRGISVEVVGIASEPYTPEQYARCLDIARWACDTNPIARRLIPGQRESGIGWHVMFGAPGPWTSVRGKACPGSQRISQVRDRLIPTITGGQSAPVPEEVVDMVLVVCPGKPLCLLAHGRLWPLDSNAQGQAYLAAGVPRQDLDPDEWEALDSASKHLAQLGA